MGDPPGGSEEDVASMAISGEPDLEVSEPPGGGEEDVAPMAISGEPSPEVGAPPNGGEEDAAPMAISGSVTVDQARRWASPPAAARKTSPPWTSTPSQAQRFASSLQHGHLFAPSATRSGNPFSPRRAVVTLP